MPAIDSRPCAMMAFPSVGPYHFARFRALRAALERTGWKFAAVSFFAEDGIYDWKERPDRSVEIEFIVGRPETGLLGGLRFCRHAWRILAAHRPSVLFAPSFWPWQNLFLVLLAKLRSCRVVLMTDSWQSTARPGWHVRLAKKLLLKLYDAAFVAGSLHRDNLVRLGFSLEKILLGYDVINNADFHPCVEARKRLKGEARRRVFLSVARFVPKKNLATLIEAYALAAKLTPGLPPLVLSGGGVLHQELEERARTCGLPVESPACFAAADLKPGGKVILLAFSSQEEVRQMYCQAVCLILASLHEEWGLVVNEAMATGLPVLVSNRVGCVPDLVVDGENGYVFDPSSVEAIAGKIVQMHALWREEQAWETMSASSLNRIASWTPDLFAANAVAALRVSMSPSRPNFAG